MLQIQKIKFLQLLFFSVIEIPPFHPPLSDTRYAAKHELELKICIRSLLQITAPVKVQVGTFLSLHMMGSFIGVFFTCGFKVRDKAPRKLTEVKRENDWGGERRVKGACV